MASSSWVWLCSNNVLSFSAARSLLQDYPLERPEAEIAKGVSYSYGRAIGCWAPVENHVHRAPHVGRAPVLHTRISLFNMECAQSHREIMR